MERKSKSLEEIVQDFQERFIASSDKSLFLSYARIDKEHADRLALNLIHLGFIAWVDRIEIGEEESKSATEDDIKRRLTAGIEKSDCFIVLLSKNSVGRPWVLWECEEVLRQQRQGKQILLLHAILDDCQVPQELDRIGRIDLRGNFFTATLDIVCHFGFMVKPKRDEPYVARPPQQENLGTSQNPMAALAYEQGLILYHRGDLVAAIAKWDMAVQIDGSFTDALYNSAVASYDLALRNKNSPDFRDLIHMVIERYERLLALRGDDVDALVNLAAAYRESVHWRNVPRETELLLRAYALAPDYGLLWLNLGHFYARQGGIDDIERFISSGASEATVTVNIASLQQAKKCFMKVDEVDPTLGRKQDTARMARLMDSLIETFSRMDRKDSVR